MKTIVGYTDRMSAMPGETLEFKVNCEADVATWRADIVRFGSTDDNPWGRGYLAHSVDADVNGEYLARRQETHTGSCLRVESAPALDRMASFAVQAVIMPTLCEPREQALIARWSVADGRGFALYLDRHGALAMRLGDGYLDPFVLSSALSLREHAWYFVAASFDAATSTVRLIQRPIVAEVGMDERADITTQATCVPAHNGLPLLIAAWSEDAVRTTAHFNGRVDSPSLTRRPLSDDEMTQLLNPPLQRDLLPDVVAAWDFGRNQGSRVVADLSQNHFDGVLVNQPARGITGWRWDSSEMNFNTAPSHYSAIHFHDDDMIDAGWETAFSWKLPDDLPSGVYAARLQDGNEDEHVVFFVRPKPGATHAKVAYLAGTATYLAYANYQVLDKYTGYELYLGASWNFGPEDIYLADHPELGKSTYHRHRDGSPVYYSSCRRPILNMRPNSVLWAFNGDMMVLDWLEARGYGFDVITDEDLHREGARVLEPYRAVLTGGHPEYYSRQMLDALESYTDTGGGLMYLGGNGFHSCVTFHRDIPGLLERRWVHGGACPPGPGEGYYSLSGEPGGGWLELGRPESRLSGLEFCASAFDCGGWYRRSAASYACKHAWIFDGVEDELFGDFGLAGGGAAGQELDWYLGGPGFPANVTVLASSEGHTHVMHQSLTFQNLSVDAERASRADMVIYDRPNGGQVFSVGSISWPQSLSWNHYENDVSRVTANVLDSLIERERSLSR